MIKATEPWPSDVRLFQPFEVDQILLPDNANCLAVKAFLKMCQLPFEVDNRQNAEFMSPNGEVPFIKCGAFVISELEPITQFVNNKGISLTDDLDSDTKLDMRAYMSLVHNVLSFSELYVTWVDPRTLVEVTYPRNGYPYPWPLNVYQNYRKRRQIVRKLKAHGWYGYTLEAVFEKVEKCCAALSEKLGDNVFFFGNKLREVDCMLFAHFFTILTTSLPYPASGLAGILRKFDKLLCHCRRVEHTVMGTVTNIFPENIACMYTSNKVLLAQLTNTIKQNEDERKKRYSRLREYENCTETVISDMLGSEYISNIALVPDEICLLASSKRRATAEVEKSMEFSDCTRLLVEDNTTDESDWVNISSVKDSQHDLNESFSNHNPFVDLENTMSPKNSIIKAQTSLDTLGRLLSSDSNSDSTTIDSTSSIIQFGNYLSMNNSLMLEDVITSTEDIFTEEDDWVTLDFTD